MVFVLDKAREPLREACFSCQRYTTTPSSGALWHLPQCSGPLNFANHRSVVADHDDVLAAICIVSPEQARGHAQVVDLGLAGPSHMVCVEFAPCPTHVLLFLVVALIFIRVLGSESQC